MSIGVAVAASGTGVHLQRATVPVADLDASIRFYTRLLGFRVRSNTAYDTPALRAMFPMPEDAKPRLVLLDGSTAEPRSLALVHAPGADVNRSANRRHAPALVFSTERMDEVHGRMVGAGVDIVLSPTPLIDFSGRPMGREAAYLDPNGVRIILIEYD